MTTLLEASKAICAELVEGYLSNETLTALRAAIEREEEQPQQPLRNREWVELTDEEIYTRFEKIDLKYWPSTTQIARAIEQLCKEKNT